MNIRWEQLRVACAKGLKVNIVRQSENNFFLLLNKWKNLLCLLPEIRKVKKVADIDKKKKKKKQNSKWSLCILWEYSRVSRIPSITNFEITLNFWAEGFNYGKVKSSRQTSVYHARFVIRNEKKLSLNRVFRAATRKNRFVPSNNTKTPARKIKLLAKFWETTEFIDTCRCRSAWR